ncbi:helix-turn-helix transcriptional regulator [Halarchaeum nitratireducens]|uniref:Transcriptional regulator n=1 Tax=Halarchaeum nitratireducens TaxID=489913 RepID=A0A830GEW2_9EURY|nr:MULTISPECIES: helix-turn-helix transcriptional regulator [Halarchaeum]MBP2250964.1 putative transcriptional regulator [Halarchaeum solikamskense]GGN21375.1 transcriptional regulator [Halarchaeum nitratireducens]
MQNDLPKRRRAAELSQGDLAEAVGVTRQTINAIERERYDPSLELAFKLTAYFDCAIEDMFDPEELSE